MELCGPVKGRKHGSDDNCLTTNSTPVRGRKLCSVHLIDLLFISYELNYPARGRKAKNLIDRVSKTFIRQATPQGDGTSVVSRGKLFMVSAMTDAERGREISKVSRLSLCRYGNELDVLIEKD